MNLACCVIAVALLGADDGRAGAKADDGQEIWAMSLREAARISLERGALARVTFAGDRNRVYAMCFGGEPPGDAERRPRPSYASRSSIVIEPVDTVASTSSFKSDVMEIIRSVEEEYWKLAEAHVRVWAADRMVRYAQDLVGSAQAVGDPSCPDDLSDLIDACGRLDQFRREFVAATAGVNHAEHDLRKLMGISESDRRQIIPVSPPTEARLVFGWGTCLDDVITKPSGYIHLNALCSLPRENVIEALQAFDDALPKVEMRLEDELSVSLWALAAAQRRSGQYYCNYGNPPVNWVPYRRMSREIPEDFAQAVIEADRNYNYFAGAKRERVGAEEIMAIDRVEWSKGRITAERYLDQVERWGALVVNERHYLTRYNSAIAQVNEYQDTLLDQYNIVAILPHQKIANFVIPISMDYTDETCFEGTEETRR